MSSAASSSHSSAWRQPLYEKHAKFDIDLSAEATDEQTFRSRFEALCRSLQERRYTTLLVSLRFHRINILASTLDALEVSTPPQNLAALVWGSASALFKVAGEARLQLASIVDLLAPLNAAVPQVMADIHRFSSEAALLDPLRRTISIWMRTLWQMTAQIRDGRSLEPYSRSRSLEDDIRDAITMLKKEEDIFKRLMTDAAQRAQHAREAQPYINNTQARAGPVSNEVSPQFLTGRFLGRGSEGDVYQVIEPTTGVVYARKQIRIGDSSSVPSRAELRVRNEVSIMQRLQHQHIATVLFWLREPAACFIYMTPCADMNLGVFLETASNLRFPDDILSQIVPWYGCLLDALTLVHKFNIIHQDIKPSNILVKGGRVFLADFGEAKDVSQTTGAAKGDYMACGTPMYRAPEVVDNVSRGLPVDVFSLGCVFSEMLTVLCKRSLGEYELYRRHSTAPDVRNNDKSFRADLKRTRRWLTELDPDQSLDIIVYLIKCMLIEEPAQRKSASQLWSLLSSAQSSVRYYCQGH